MGNNFCYFKDIEKQLPPRGYTEKNYLDYYVFRNNFILKQLAKERWVKNKKLVVAGHAEGSTIAAKMAAVNKKITHLIYSGGNPYGRIMTILAQSRSCGTDTMKEGNTIIQHWQKVVRHANDMHSPTGDSYKTIYSFSLPQQDNLMQLKIPVLVCYGIKGRSVPFNDLFQIEAIREKKENISFKSYLHLAQDDLPLQEDNNENQPLYQWDKIAGDWLSWLEK